MTGTSASTIYHFEGFELDIGMFELRRNHRTVAVGPRGFDVLCYLVEHRDRVVPKEELLSSVWSVSVGESVLPRCMTVLRRALDDDGGIIETVRGRGYRFAAAVTTEERPAAERRSTMPPPPYGDERSRTTLVGRTEALDELRASLDGIRLGRGAVVLLYGEPGIGKTALVRELHHFATVRGIPSVTGRGYERAESVPFWPWIEALRSLVTATPRDALEAALSPQLSPLLELLPELEELLPAPNPQPQSPDRARLRLFDAVLQLLERITQRTPLLLTIEDAHCADTASLRLLEFVGRSVGRMPLLLAVTHRDLDLPTEHALRQALGALAREPDCHRIELGGFTRGEVAQYIESSGLPRADASLAERIRSATGGNPLFVAELVRLARDAGRWSALDSAGLPRRVLDAVREQLATLSPATNAVLEAAAVMGREIQPGLLAKTMSITGQDALASLDEATAARILRRDEKGHAFRHAIVRDAVYEHLSEARRAALHRAYADALEDVGSLDDAQVAALAHHYSLAVPTGAGAKALAYLRRAASAALRAHAPEQAADLLARCAGLTEAERLVDDRQRIELLLDLGEAQARARQRAQARATFEKAARAAQELGDAKRFARAAVGFAGEAELFLPKDESRLQLLESALRHLGDSGPLELRSILVSELSGTAPHWEDLDKRRALATEALDLARRSGSDRALARALWARCHALLGPDHVDECLSHANEMLDLSVRMGSPLDEVHAMEVLMIFQIARGEVGDARGTLDLVERVARENDFAFWQWWVRSSRASMAIIEGRFPDARRLIAETRELGRNVEHPLVLPVSAGQGMQLGVLTGDFEMVGGSFDTFEHFSWGPRMTKVSRAMLADALGQRDAEAAIVATFPEDPREIPRDEFWLMITTMMGISVAGVGDTKRAAALYELLLPYRSWNAIHLLTRLHLGSVSGTLARLAECLGDVAEARNHYERALRMNRRTGAWAAHWLVQWAYATHLMRSADPQDQSRGRALADETRQFADRLGMRPLVARVDKALG